MKMKEMIFPVIVVASLIVAVVHHYIEKDKELKLQESKEIALEVKSPSK